MTNENRQKLEQALYNAYSPFIPTRVRWRIDNGGMVIVNNQKTLLRIYDSEGRLQVAVPPNEIEEAKATAEEIKRKCLDEYTRCSWHVKALLKYPTILRCKKVTAGLTYYALTEELPSEVWNQIKHLFEIKQIPPSQSPQPLTHHFHKVTRILKKIARQQCSPSDSRLINDINKKVQKLMHALGRTTEEDELCERMESIMSHMAEIAKYCNTVYEYYFKRNPQTPPVHYTPGTWSKLCEEYNNLYSEYSRCKELLCKLQQRL